jgi:hypothetical protein
MKQQTISVATALALVVAFGAMGRSQAPGQEPVPRRPRPDSDLR